MTSFYFLKSLLINIMILYNISIHTLFHSDGFECLSVCHVYLSACQCIWRYVWARSFIGSTVSGCDSKIISKSDFFFLLNLVQNDGSCSKHGFHSSRISEKVFVLSFCIPIIPPHPTLTVKCWSAFLTESSADCGFHKMKLYMLG